MSERLQFALPIAVPALVTLLFSPFFVWVVRSNVSKLRKNETTTSLVGEQPEDFADLAIWAIDQYQLLILIVISPIIGGLYGHTRHLDVAVLVYVGCEISVIVLYLVVASQSNASVYISKSELGRFPIVRHIARPLPFLSSVSMTAVASAVIYVSGSVLIGAFAR
jgi:hypothetical protein